MHIFLNFLDPFFIFKTKVHIINVIKQETENTVFKL